MTLTRPYLAWILALLLAVTSQSMAVARGMASPDGEIVLCTGNGVSVVLVDAEGNPTGPAHICPDCALTFFSVFASEPFALVLERSHGVRVGFQEPADRTLAASVRAQARSPPYFI